MRRATLRRERGQAMVETVLGLMLVVTTVLVGVHLADVGYLSLKVHEAAASAMWDATAYRVHSLGTGAGSFYDSTNAANTAQNMGEARYRDYDGRRSANHAAPSFALTNAEQIQVVCARDNGVAFGLGALAPRYGEPGGVSCRAFGGVSIANVPNRYFENGAGGFQAPLKPFAGTIPICSSGRGACGDDHRMSVLLGDYGLAGPNTTEATDCGASDRDTRTGTCPNAPFYSLTRGLFDDSMIATAGWGAGDRDYPAGWVSGIVGVDPPDRGKHITGFYMSYRGRNAVYDGAAQPFNERLVNDGFEYEYWEAEPFARGNNPSRESFRQRSQCSDTGGYCYLGVYPTR